MWVPYSGGETQEYLLHILQGVTQERHWGNDLRPGLQNDPQWIQHQTLNRVLDPEGRLQHYHSHVANHIADWRCKVICAKLPGLQRQVGLRLLQKEHRQCGGSHGWWLVHNLLPNSTRVQASKCDEHRELQWDHRPWKLSVQNHGAVGGVALVLRCKSTKS